MSTQQPPSTQLHSISIEDPTKNSFVLDGLEEFTLYEVLLQVSCQQLAIFFYLLQILPILGNITGVIFRGMGSKMTTQNNSFVLDGLEESR